MKLNKAVWLPIISAFLLLTLSTSYPALAGLLFLDEGGRAKADIASSDRGPTGPEGTAVPLVTAFKVPVKPILTLIALPTSTPTKKPIIKLPPGIIATLVLQPPGPADTPTPTPPPPTWTPEPTWTPQPTWTPVIPPTWTPVVPQACVPNAAFVADVTAPDGTAFAPGTVFQKMWRVRNIGTCAWDSSYQLSFQLGNPMGAGPAQPIPSAAPGQTVDVAVTMQAPANLGPAENHWRLKDTNGQLFGPDLYVKIVAVQAAPPPSATLPPTLQPVVPALTIAASTPATEVDTSKFTSAREAFNLIWPTVWNWRKTASLYSATCDPQPVQAGIQFFTPWQGAALGKCAGWQFNFLENPTAGPGSKQYRAVVTQSQTNAQQSGEQDLLEQARSVGTDWLDSPDALQGYLQQGGADFFARHPQGRIVALSLRAGFDGKPYWSMSATSRSDNLPGSIWTASVDAPSGQVNSLPVTTALPGKLYLSAREAFATALKVAQAWKPDAQPQQIRAQVNPDEGGHAVGKASSWSFTFASPAARRGLTLDVVDGAAANARETDLPAGDAIAGNWPDSPDVLAVLKTTPDYQAFASLYPQSSLIYVLLGNVQLGDLWIAGAFGTNASVTTNVSAPQ